MPRKPVRVSAASLSCCIKEIATDAVMDRNCKLAEDVSVHIGLWKLVPRGIWSAEHEFLIHFDPWCRLV
ncbi:hypothetical protein Y032_0739g1960 [Ancylostoma ceylanicum]|uniref:Uncharacterized protein n=1 Tax=Ancylostoma ceylanicum TaxID=53326 RepID=A0A016WEX4_9BILA|nr:hypothetical protein Y032_0739g1960 [Ancylostoma ceylanicum]